MKSKIPLREILFVVSIAGVTFYLILMFVFNLKPGLFPGSQNLQNLTDANGIVSVAVPRQVISGLPLRLRIPKINVDAPFEYVGVTPDLNMDVPKRPDYVAWFELGPRPGEEGSAVITGHEGWKNGIPAVFDNLYKLKKGDKLYVEDIKGTTTIFVVRELRTYREDEDASDVFSSRDGKIHLNLITCKGVWNKTKQSYSDRLVVFSDKVDSTPEME